MDDNVFFDLLDKRLKGKISSAEKQTLQEYIRDNPERQALYHWLSTSGVGKSEDTTLEHKFAHILERLDDPAIVMEQAPSKSTKRLLFTRTNIIAAAILLFILSIAFLVYQNHNFFSPEGLKIETVHVDKGNRKHIVMPDGTEIWINGGSTLTYDEGYAKTNRAINLIGEAFFKVTKNKELPMVVTAKNYHVKVLGTSFNVRSYADENIDETSLVEGKIEFSMTAAEKKVTYSLAPGEKLKITAPTKGQQHVTATAQLSQEEILEQPGNYILSKTNFVKKSIFPTPAEISWKSDTLAFDGEPLERVISKLEKWYNIPMELKNMDLKDVKISGTFKEETLMEVLGIMRMSGVNMSIQKTNGTLIIN